MIITQNAKDLIGLIAEEHELQLERYMKGFIEKSQVAGCLLERLNAKAKSDPSLKQFMETLAYIPPSEDEDPDAEWAEDPREAGHHIVDHRTSTPEPHWPRTCLDD